MYVILTPEGIEEIAQPHTYENLSFDSDKTEDQK
jgi:hypothetical protein